MTTRPVSSLAFEKVYPPLVSLSPVKAFKTPICAYQHTVDAFLSSMLTGGAGRLAPPAGSCEDLYGAPSAP